MWEWQRHKMSSVRIEDVNHQVTKCSRPDIYTQKCFLPREKVGGSHLEVFPHLQEDGRPSDMMEHRENISEWRKRDKQLWQGVKDTSCQPPSSVSRWLRPLSKLPWTAIRVRPETVTWGLQGLWGHVRKRSGRVQSGSREQMKSFYIDIWRPVFYCQSWSQ